jgi:putative nucleotidyltransferase with HDIG domain
MSSNSARPGKPGKASSTLRRQELRRRLPRTSGEFWVKLRRPEVVYGLISSTVFVLMLTSLIAWAQTARLPYVGELIHQPIVNLVDFEVEDNQATERARTAARQAAPLIFAPKRAYLDQMQAALEGLPVAVAESKTIQDVNEDLVTSFGLSQQTLSIVQEYAPQDGDANTKWNNWTKTFINYLWRKNPILLSEDSQAFKTTLNRATLSEITSTEKNQGVVFDPVPLDDEVELGEGEESRADVKHELEMLARRAGFPRDVTPIVVQRLMDSLQATAYVDQKLTTAVADSEARKVEPMKVEHARGEVLALPGDVLNPEQIVRIAESERAYEQTSNAMIQRYLALFGIFGVTAGICALLAAYSAVFYPLIAKNPLRLATILSVVLLATSCAIVVGVKLPSLTVLASLSANLVVVIMFALAYDRRIALFAAIMQIIIIAIALGLDATMIAAQLITCATMASMLDEIRNRRAMIRAATITALVGGSMFALPMIVDLAISGNAFRIVLINIGSAVASAYLVGFVMLGALPSIESIFKLTTGLTLSELRDPRHPLLRQMQQKAPGTYNHSLQIANIAEEAAESIGANGLLVYVGALYHDIGKIDKPEYFIENQAGGPNKHDKLSPAMSLLVITGHVKDGIELAREYGLPRVVLHFIESHHGTTLVEYFFHAARTKAAEEGQENAVEEFEFRYPGPKPRTKEAAILMLCDCIESAARALGEPNPSRIETLVRALGRKRLEDGQFDECPLSFRELKTVEDSIIKSLCAIYHGRIAYPTKQTAAEEESSTPTTKSVSA